MQDTGNQYRLIVRRGPQPNQTFDLKGDVITLGRDITNDIVINDPEVSRHHLRITKTADGYTLEDLGSTNGTFIAGQRITGVRALNRGDLIGLGETVTLLYDMVRPEVSPPAPGPAAPSATVQSSPAPQPQSPQPAQPAYSSAPPPPQPDYGYDYDQDYGGYDSPRAPGYDYDPYAVREEEPSNAWRWILIGCAGLLLFCCCATVLGLVIIDLGNLWCKIPIFKDIITPIFGLIGEALGIISNAQTC
ncbi:MAG: hypothetical protein CUN56_10490 [Phototrophicales bacterium]|nr:MAG: hypothetical protein CUN56_10490 [Phototrophicales bacterium]RMG74506.1 MAG: FHA domain-containing protein [Chloroflexota bacterium]